MGSAVRRTGGSLGHPDSPTASVATDAVVDELYGLEMTTTDGPLMTAFTERSAVRINDTTTESDWPAWRHFGIRTVLHLPLLTTRAAVGVLSFYHAESNAFSDDDVAIADLIGRHTAIALAAARTEATLTEAVDARRLIGQAMGILMERHQIDDERAFAVLRRYSQDTNTKLRDVALRLIQTGQLPQ